MNRTIEKAEELANRINIFTGRKGARAGGEGIIEKEVSDAAVIINVSTKGAIGAFENYSALAKATLPATSENIAKNIEAAEEIFAKIPKEAILSDIVLRDSPSQFLKRAEELGFETLDGVPMVVNQGVEAFLIIHGQELAEHPHLRDEVYETMHKAANF